MLEQFKKYNSNEKLFSQDDSILLAVSGGMDSVVMAELFHLAGIKFGIAHCNFQLRGSDSNKDEAFVGKMAANYKVKIHSIRFDTNAYAEKNKVSTQVAARELRYEWFEKIATQYNYKHIATAHHLSDAIETLFINLTRGTGISGLHGILPKNGNIIRPLLFCTKDDIINYVTTNKLKYRVDKSNDSLKYTRNKIRKEIIPVLKDINPGFENTIEKSISHFRDVETIFNAEIEKQRSKILVKTVGAQNDEWKININIVKKLSPLKTYLYEFIKPFNFTSDTVDSLINSFDSISGKLFYSNTHKITKDRSYLIIEKKTRDASKAVKVEKGTENIVIENIELSFMKKGKQEINKNETTAQVDLNKLAFPLEIRKWEKGDVFFPLGMKGKKKLSDYFIDKKLSLPEKNNTWILTSKGKIVWIIGHRLDNRFKVTEETKDVLEINLKQQHHLTENRLSS